MKKSKSLASCFYLAVLLFFASGVYSATLDNGAFGSYLIGTFDLIPLSGFGLAPHLPA